HQPDGFAGAVRFTTRDGDLFFQLRDVIGDGHDFEFTLRAGRRMGHPALPPSRCYRRWAWPSPCILRTRPIIKSVALTLKLGGMYAGVGHPSHGTGSAISVAPGGGTGDSGAAVQNSIPHRAGDRRAGPVVCSQPSAYFPKSEHGISGVSATAAVR